MPYPLAVNDAGIIEPQPIDPTETFVNADDSGLSEASILDYWVWAFSDLAGNTERGVLAEYLVAMAIGAKSPVRNSWGAYDLDAPDGTKFEVKSAAFAHPAGYATPLILSTPLSIITLSATSGCRFFRDVFVSLALPLLR
jgi:hypothetical protein